jgi:hypothetical protein
MIDRNTVADVRDILRFQFGNFHKEEYCPVVAGAVCKEILYFVFGVIGQDKQKKTATNASAAKAITPLLIT